MGHAATRITALRDQVVEAASMVAEHDNELTEHLIARAAAAHQGTRVAGGTDAAYLLGERNAYAEAAGLTLSHGVESLTYAIANHITDDLVDGLTDLGELVQRASSIPPAKARDVPEPLKWIGPLAFTRRYAGRGVDEDLGTEWGPRQDQRITHRHQLDSDEGLLYAYDPIWHEYAVIAEHVSLRDVRHAYADALHTNPHLPVGAFASQVATTADRRLRGQPAEAEL